MNFDHSSQRVFRCELKSRILSLQQSATEQEMKKPSEGNSDCSSASFTGWVNSGFSLEFSRGDETEEQVLISTVVSLGH